MKITAPQGAIIDVILSQRMQDDEGAMPGQAGTAISSTVGVIYVNYLDGFTSKQLQPIQGTMVVLP